MHGLLLGLVIFALCVVGFIAVGFVSLIALAILDDRSTIRKTNGEYLTVYSKMLDSSNTFDDMHPLMHQFKEFCTVEDRKVVKAGAKLEIRVNVLEDSLRRLQAKYDDVVERSRYLEESLIQFKEEHGSQD